MLDKKLVDEVRKMKLEGIHDQKDLLRIFEFWKQLSELDNRFREALYASSTMMVQFENSETNTQFWIAMGDGEIDYGQGEVVGMINIKVHGNTKEFADICLGNEPLFSDEFIMRQKPGEEPTGGETGFIEGVIEYTMEMLENGVFDEFS